MLVPFGPEIWIADGDQVSVAGFHYPTRMAVIRLPSGGLLVWSPVALGTKLQAEVAVLGTVTDILAPNSLHHLFLQAWQAAFPNARTHGAPGLAKKRADLRFSTELGEAADPAWAGHVDQVVIRGNLITTEVVFFHRASGTVLFTDLIQQFPPGWFTGWRAIIARLDHMEGTVPRVPKKFRITCVQRAKIRAVVRIILDWPVEKILMAHGVPVKTDAKAALRRMFDWLRP